MKKNEKRLKQGCFYKESNMDGEGLWGKKEWYGGEGGQKNVQTTSIIMIVFTVVGLLATRARLDSASPSLI